jgi:preprotein translocase subunit SecE
MENWKKTAIEFVIVFVVFFTFTYFMLDTIIDAIDANLKRYEWKGGK